MLGDRLRKAREAMNYTQEELASVIGSGSKEIWRYENGKSRPTSDTIAKIAQELNISSDYLLGISDDPKPGLAISELSVKEKLIVIALRSGDKYGAIELIVNADK